MSARHVFVSSRLALAVFLARAQFSLKQTVRYGLSAPCSRYTTKCAWGDVSTVVRTGQFVDDWPVSRDQAYGWRLSMRKRQLLGADAA
jgi:hypothetical protein